MAPENPYDPYERDDRSEAEKVADAEKQAFGELDRAHRAKTLLEDQLFIEAVQAVMAGLNDDFARSQLNDDEMRRNARIGVEMLDRILKALRKHVETGKMAKSSLSEIEKKRTWHKRFAA